MGYKKIKLEFMEITKYLKKYIVLIFLICIVCSCRQGDIKINDGDGVLGKTNAPVSLDVKLNKNQKIAAEEGRLGLRELAADQGKDHLIPVQIESINDRNPNLIMIMPHGEPGIRRFKLIENETSSNKLIKASRDTKSGQVTIAEEDKKILQYNFQTVYEKDVVRLDYEKLEEHTRTEADTFVTVSIYAVPRSNYIHPLYGLEGEMLTRDWPDGGHPHHRGIYWAWPEVEYESEFGDPHALQKIFSRPTGEMKYSNGPVFAQVIAENLWMWEDAEPIVHEHAVIRAYTSSSTCRIIDLTLRFTPLKEGITIATRGKNSYGGLNLRLQFPESQEISYFTEKDDSQPKRAWSDFSGIFTGAESPSGLMVLQHQDNPDYPGDWVEYPELAWVQPTFPASGTRYPLSKEEPLVLRYRLVVHKGGLTDENIAKNRWDAFHVKLTPLYNFTATK
jgi:hypothetical protein